MLMLTMCARQERKRVTQVEWERQKGRTKVDQAQQRLWDASAFFSLSQALLKTKQPRLTSNCGSDETWIQWTTTRSLLQC